MSSEPNENETPRPDGTAEDMLTLTDPKSMRAMAHPLRIALVELFAVHETLTATQASEALGESPANCAFHLRTLAKYGFIEEAGGGRGRERPWKAMATTIRLSTTDLDDQQAVVAANALEQVWIDRQLARIRATLAADRPPEWSAMTTAHQSILFLTPAEAQALQDEFHTMFLRYTERGRNPSLRPAGALPVEFNVFGFLREDLAALLPDTDEKGAAGTS